MPFISATAFVHSVMIQERRGMLKVWTVFLICFTFFMTIFGTFLTRSGAIASVHSFAQSSIGTYFVYFLLLLGAFAATLVFYRWPELRDLKPTMRLRRAALVTGWITLLGTAPGIAILLGRGGLSTTMRVVSFIGIETLVVYVALEVVYRVMTKSLDMTAKRPRFESILSREFTFLLNNWILMGLLGFILIATTFPMITEALLNEKVTVGPPFYNAWVQPLGLVLIFLMGVGTLFGWRKTSKAALRRALIAPVAVGVGVAVLHFALGSTIGFPAVVWGDAIYDGALGSALRAFNAITPVLGISLCAFNAAVTVQEFVAPARGLQADRSRTKMPPPRCGGYVPSCRSRTRSSRCRRRRVAATAATSSTSASWSCSSASRASRGQSTARRRSTLGSRTKLPDTRCSTSARGWRSTTPSA